MKSLLIVDTPAATTAATLFQGSMEVRGNTGAPEDDFDASGFAGRDIVLWCHYATFLAERIAPVAARVRIVNGDRTPLSFGGSGIAAAHYAKANITTYSAPEQPAATQVLPEPSAPAVGAPAQPETVSAGVEAVPAEKKAKKPKRERTEGTSWADFGLVLNDEGIPVCSLDNCVRVIEKHPALAGNIWFDRFLQKILHTWGLDVPAEWSDYDDVRLALYLQREIGIPRVGKGLAGDAVLCYAKREVRNCAYDWMDGLHWDGKPRLMDLATRGFGAVNNEYNRQVCRNLILSIVKRVFEPGCKSDYMPMFEGEQGDRKSQALELIGRPWFAELSMSWENKDFLDALQGKMLVEIAELHAFRQSEFSKIKAVVSCRVDRFRPAYARHTQDFPRQCVFAGTHNPGVDGWNRDETGARRFWPVAVGKIDLGWIEANRDALFAEAVHDIHAGALHWQVPWDQAKLEQDERRPTDAWEDTIREWLKGRNEVTLTEVMTDALGIEKGRQSLSDQQRVGRVMKKLEWVKKNRRVHNGPGGQYKIWASPLAAADPLSVATTEPMPLVGGLDWAD